MWAPEGRGVFWNRWSLTTPTGAAAGRLGKAMTGRRGLWNIRPCAETWVGWGEILGMGVRPRWNR